MILVDYQLLRYCPPPVDILFMIYANTTKIVRDKHFDQILKEYYHELERTLAANHIDLNEIYSFETFWENVQEMRAPCMCLCLCYTQVICCPKDYIQSILEDGEKAQMFYTGNRGPLLDIIWNNEMTYRTRIREYVQDLHKILTE